MTWQQSAYVSKTTQIACLPNMTGDVQQILDRFAPGCKLQNQDGNSTPTLKLNTRKHVSPTSADCKVASLLYPGDIYLWHRHCEPPGKSGAGVEMAINGSRLDTASKVQQQNKTRISRVGDKSVVSHRPQPLAAADGPFVDAHLMRSPECRRDIEATQWEKDWLPSNTGRSNNNPHMRNETRTIRCCHASCKGKALKKCCLRYVRNQKAGSTFMVKTLQDLFPQLHCVNSSKAAYSHLPFSSDSRDPSEPPAVSRHQLRNLPELSVPGLPRRHLAARGAWH